MSASVEGYMRILKWTEFVLCWISGEPRN